MLFAALHGSFLESSNLRYRYPLLTGRARGGRQQTSTSDILGNKAMKLPKRPIIETNRLILRLVEKGDLPALFAVNGDKKVFRYSPRENWKSPADGRKWFSRIMAHRKNGATMQFVIVLRDGGHPIGTLAAFHFEDSVGSAEVGYVLGRKHWGKGIMKEALAAFVAFAFDRLKLKRLEAELDPRNAASAKVLERVGFSREGLRRRNYFSKGEVTDTALYGMLSRDPRPRTRSPLPKHKRNPRSVWAHK